MLTEYAYSLYGEKTPSVKGLKATNEQQDDGQVHYTKWHNAL